MDDRYRERYRLLGLKISLYRKLRGFTQEEFAEKIDLSVSFISQIEANNGQRIRGISLNTLFRMAEALEIPVSFLIDDRSEPVYTDRYTEKLPH